MKTWMRLLYVRLYNEDTNREIVIGKTLDDSKKPYITISGHKELSPLKDNFTIKIKNLSYKQMLDIMNEQLFSVSIYAGYLGEQNYNNFTAKCIFSGGIINIVNEKTDYKENTTTFVCASKALAKNQQFRLNVSFNSGINMYSAIQYISRMAGYKLMNIDEDYKKTFYNQLETASGSAVNYLDQLSNTHNNFYITTDSSNDNSYLNAISLLNQDREPLNIDPSKARIIGGYPQITSSGVQWTSLPVYNYTPGLLVKMNNALINTSSGLTNASGTINNAPNTTYLSKKGLYYIFTLDYNLDNKNGTFQITILAKSKDLFTQITTI